MGKIRAGALVVALLGAWLVAPQHPFAARAQMVQPTSCTQQPPAYPMQGHYTGIWHSDGDYHFSVFGTDLDLKVTIDGKLDVYVAPDGSVSGSATGNVDAPITDYGHRDISSGIGTISGGISGSLANGGALTLSQPVIDMHWGTFGGGHAVERTIVMPEYSFGTTAVDCISGSGSITETNFPEQNVVADGAGQVTQAPGIGTATGSWNLQSDEAQRFADLSQRVDAYISSANALLTSGSTPLYGAVLTQTLIQPLQALETEIRASPDVERCLLARLAVWEGSALPGLFAQAQSLASSPTLVNVREAADVLRVATSLDGDCGLPDGGASTSILATEASILDSALSIRDWRLAALAAREMLFGGTLPATVLARLDGGIHALLLATSDDAGMLTLARFAYASGDKSDALALLHMAARTGAAVERAHGRAKKHRKKHRRAKPTSAATPTPSSKSAGAVLLSSITSIRGSSSGGSALTLAWQPVTGAARYVLFVASDSVPAWAWAGKATSVVYGDTSIEGVDGTGGDPWPVALPSSYTWSVLAFDDSGKIVGMRLPA
ncbi:MAG: hypothetical protein ACR2JC_08735 [Chloroflexota bacterium]|nr:MAG: hypothetical protein DLM70_18895 [Chloroflexota bacterium]